MLSDCDLSGPQRVVGFLDLLHHCGPAGWSQSLGLPGSPSYPCFLAGCCGTGPGWGGTGLADPQPSSAPGSLP